jgi:hypothetical protein
MLSGLGSVAIIVASAFGGHNATDAPMQSADQCNVTVHATVNAAGNERIRVRGGCEGHAPTPADISRLLRPMEYPQIAIIRSRRMCRETLGVNERRCFMFVGTNTTVVFDKHGRVATS